MWIPPQGFRHAATLLLTNRLRGIPPQASPADVTEALARLASELVALSDDTRIGPEAREWLVAEYERTVDRVTAACDRDGAKAAARTILAAVGSQSRDTEPRDLFLVHVAEDRLPLAAPLAIELTKRRLTVAFSRFEVASGADLAPLIARGLGCHRKGVLLRTPGFIRAIGEPLLPDGNRVRILHGPPTPAGVDELASWVRAHI